METIQESSDAAITTAVLDGCTVKALYLAQKFMATGCEEDAAAVREQLAGVREAATALPDLRREESRPGDDQQWTRTALRSLAGAQVEHRSRPILR